MVKYDANQENTNTYENLQIVWSQYFTDKLLSVYIQSNSKSIGYQYSALLPMNTNEELLSTFDYLNYLVSYLMRDNKGNFKLFAVTKHILDTNAGNISFKPPQMSN
jgi:hypothetical protein